MSDTVRFGWFGWFPAWWLGGPSPISQIRVTFIFCVGKRRDARYGTYIEDVRTGDQAKHVIRSSFGGSRRQLTSCDCSGKKGFGQDGNGNVSALTVMLIELR